MPGEDTVRLIRELGYDWGPPVTALLLFSLVLWVRWKQQYRKFRSLFLNWSICIVLVLGLVGNLLFYRYYAIPSPFAENKIGILIAQIPGDTNAQQQQTYADAILRAVAEASDMRDVVKVALLGRPLPRDPDKQHQTALKLGRRLRAAFVIRPVLVEGGHSLWLTIVDQPDFPSAEAKLEKVSRSQLAEVEKLPLPSDVTLLARCALAFSYFRRDRFSDAIPHFTQILAAPKLPPAAASRPFLLLVLGESHWENRSQNRASSLPKAIAAYDEALREWPRERYPAEWAETLGNRGSAYGELPGPDRAANLREAIRCYDLALEVLTSERYPIQWAQTMNNRGTAYQELPGPKLDPEANLREAIRSYNLALEVRTRARSSADWAMTMNNRGIAYGELKGPDREANLREAIRCYDLVLDVYTRVRYPRQWAATMNNRGNAYAYLELSAPDRMANLREAIHCYDLALGVQTREHFPVDWAITTNNRGEAYQKLPGPDREINLREAIRCFETAAEEFEHQKFMDYAKEARKNLLLAKKQLQQILKP